MKKIKIDKNIPITKIKQSGDRKYPFSEMKVGDSFFVKKNKKESYPIRAKVQSCFRNFIKSNKSKIKIATRSVNSGIRVWRIK